MIVDVGPSPVNFVSGDPKRGGSGRAICLAASADRRRMYAGGYSGVWRSDDGGVNWRQMGRPQPGTYDAEVPGALFAPYVIDLAVSPADPNLVIAVAEGSPFAFPSRNGVYRSIDGGETWSLAPNTGNAGQVVFAPDDPNLVMVTLGANVAISTDAGANWTLSPVDSQIFSSGAQAWHIAIAPLERQSGVRRVYAAGGNRIWRSVNGGMSWQADLGASLIVRLPAGRPA